jgi:hypothetical protein
MRQMLLNKKYRQRQAFRVRHCELANNLEGVDLSTILDCSQAHNDGRGGDCGYKMRHSPFDSACGAVTNEVPTIRIARRDAACHVSGTSKTIIFI